MKFITALGALLICAAVPAAELHPIVEVQSGYLFGAIADGKWIKANEAAKLIGDGTTFRVGKGERRNPGLWSDNHDCV